MYQKMLHTLNKYPKMQQTIRVVNKISTLLLYSAYPIFIVYLLFRQDHRIYRALLTPAISFVLLSVFRSYMNAPRPYEKLDIIPIIDKDTAGNSFPSRHVFSTFVIAATIYHVFPGIGLILMFVGLILATMRVLGGVHFPRDVIAGALIGILSAWLGFYL